MYTPDHMTHFLRLLSLQILVLISAPPADALDRVADLPKSWRFQTDPKDIGLAEEWQRRGLRGKMTQIAVPALWEDHGFDNYDGIGWYEASFRIDSFPAGRKTAVLFRSVDDNTRVWLNGEPLGSNEGWNTPFYFDIHDRALVGTENRLTVRVEDFGGGGGIYKPVEIVAYTNPGELLMTPLYEKHRAQSSPDWVADLNIYQVFLRTITPSGTLVEFKALVPKLAEMGVKMIWFMPIHPVGAVKRKGQDGSPYAVKDYLAVNPAFGDLEAFKDVAAAAHRENVKVIIDWVANHTAWDNSLITEHPEWFRTDNKGEIVPPNPSWHDVAQLDFGKRALNEYMADALCFWIREADIDGYRCDVASMVPDPFWNLAFDRMVRIKRDVVMLAESSRAEHHLNGFDMTYDDGFYHHIVSVARGKSDAASLAQYVVYGQYGYPRGARRMTFIENHDKERAVNVLGRSKVFPAAAVLFTADGVPLVYNGQEAGLSEKRDIFDKYTLDWAQADGEINQWHRQLYALRNSHETLRRGSSRPVRTNRPDAVCAFVREGRGRRILVAANFSDGEVESALEDPETGSTLLAPSNMNDLVTGRPAILRGSWPERKLRLKPNSAVVLALD